MPGGPTQQAFIKREEMKRGTNIVTTWVPTRMKNGDRSSGAHEVVSLENG